MKINRLLILLLLLANLSFSQKRNGIQDYPTVAGIQTETIVPNANDKIFVKALGKFFYWDATSTATHDGTTVIKQNSIATGRFLTVGANVSDPTVQQINATGTVLSWNSTIEIGATALTANITITLPTCVANIGKAITFKRLDNTAFTVTIVANGAETVEITTSTSLNSQFGALTLQAVSNTKSEQIGNIGTSGSIFYRQCQLIPIADNSTADRGDLILVNGRLKSTLTVAQQLVATACGYGTNILNGVGRNAIGAGTGFLPLSIGGAATQTIAQANLPNISLTSSAVSAGTPSGSIATTVNATYHSATGDGFNIGRIQLTDRNPSFTQLNPSEITVSASFSGSALGTHQHTSSLGGSGTALSTLDPYYAVPTYVYLGAANPIVTTPNTLTVTTTGTGAATLVGGALNIPLESDPIVKAISGIVKSNGTTISAATAGTDYVIPSGSITGNSANVTGIVAIANGGTGSATQNFVDLTTNQTIAGNKTINGNTVIGSVAGNTTTIGNTTGAITVNSGTGTVGISTDATANLVNIATGAGAKTLTLGSANTTSSNVITAGATGTTVFNQGGAERIRVHSNGNVGIGIAAPTSNFHLTGSEAKTPTSTATAAYTVVVGDNTINLTLVGLQTITLPTAPSFSGRVITLVNNTGINKVFAAAITQLDGGSTTAIPAYGSVKVHSDGLIWRVIESSAAINSQIGTGFFDVGQLRFQFGQGSTTAANVTVTLPAAFANATYSVTATVNGNFATSNYLGVSIVSKATTNFVTFTQQFNSGSSTIIAAGGQTYNWIAIGQKP